MFGDRGIPDGHRHMDGWGSSTYKLVNSDNKPVYNKFYWKTNQGVKNLDTQTANRLVGKIRKLFEDSINWIWFKNIWIVTDPDYSVHDLFDAIARKDYPSWTLYIQVMTYEQAAKWEFNPFDITKVRIEIIFQKIFLYLSDWVKTWPEDEYPLIEVGRMTLDRNATNYFAEVEQLSFCPATRVRGIEFSPDKLLQGRLFAYQDTARHRSVMNGITLFSYITFHRIGPNFHLIPVNRPISSMIAPTQRDGPMMVGTNQGNVPNYYPNSFLNAQDDPKNFNEYREFLSSTDVDRFESKDEDDYTQVRQFYLGFTDEERQRLYTNIASELSNVYDYIQERAYDMFGKVHSSYAEGVKKAVQMASNKAIVA